MRVSAPPDMTHGADRLRPADPELEGPRASASPARWRRSPTSAAACAGWASASLDLAYVAAGRQDGYWEHGTKPWDIAAGVLLVREAGGRVGRLEGDEELFAEGTVIAGNPDIYDKLRATARGGNAGRLVAACAARL